MHALNEFIHDSDLMDEMSQGSESPRHSNKEYPTGVTKEEELAEKSLQLITCRADYDYVHDAFSFMDSSINLSKKPSNVPNELDDSYMPKLLSFSRRPTTFEQDYSDVQQLPLPKELLNDMSNRKDLERMSYFKQSETTEKQTFRKLFQSVKLANVPKKLLKMFKASLKGRMRILKDEHKGSTQGYRERSELLRLLKTISNRLDRTDFEAAGIKGLGSVFCGEQPTKVESRKMMKLCLSQLAFEEVLRSDSIPLNSKLSYLKCLKTTEWRMRNFNDKLVARVQYHS